MPPCQACKRARSASATGIYSHFLFSPFRVWQQYERSPTLRVAAFLTDLVFVMSRLLRSTCLVVLALLTGAAPLYAQEADTTAADTTVADTAAADTMSAETMAADTIAADTTVTDTMTTEAAPSDTAKGAARRKTRRQMKADSLANQMARRVAAERTSVVERQKEATTAARAAAERWLALTDDGRFDESWQAADSTLRARISRELWIDQGRRVRSRLDTVRSRLLTKTEYRESTGLVPGDRPVVLLQYTTTFDRGKTLEALVTTKRDTAWKVAGYRVVAAPAPDTTAVDTAATDTGEGEGDQ